MNDGNVANVVDVFTCTTIVIVFPNSEEDSNFKQRQFHAHFCRARYVSSWYFVTDTTVNCFSNLHTVSMVIFNSSRSSTNVVTRFCCRLAENKSFKRVNLIFCGTRELQRTQGGRFGSQYIKLDALSMTVKQVTGN